MINSGCLSWFTPKRIIYSVTIFIFSPLIGTNIQNLAKEKDWDTLLIEWWPSMLEFASEPWFINLFFFMFGASVFAFCDSKLRTKKLANPVWVSVDYTYTSFEMEFLKDGVRRLQSSNVQKIEQLGGYSTWYDPSLNPLNDTIFLTLKVNLRQPLDMSKCAVNIVNLNGKVKTASLSNLFSGNEITSEVIMTLHNIDIDGGQYKVIFEEKS